MPIGTKRSIRSCCGAARSVGEELLAGAGRLPDLGEVVPRVLGVEQPGDIADPRPHQIGPRAHDAHHEAAAPVVAHEIDRPCARSPRARRRATSTYSSLVAPKPSGTGMPKPGSCGVTTSVRWRCSSSGPQIAGVSGLPWTRTAVMATTLDVRELADRSRAGTTDAMSDRLSIRRGLLDVFWNRDLVDGEWKASAPARQIDSSGMVGPMIGEAQIVEREQSQSGGRGEQRVVRSGDRIGSRERRCRIAGAQLVEHLLLLRIGVDAVPHAGDGGQIVGGDRRQRVRPATRSAASSSNHAHSRAGDVARSASASRTRGSTVPRSSPTTNAPARAASRQQDRQQLVGRERDVRAVARLACRPASRTGGRAPSRGRCARPCTPRRLARIVCDERLVQRVAQPPRHERRDAPVLSVGVERIGRRADAHVEREQVLVLPRVGAAGAEADRRGRR